MIPVRKTFYVFTIALMVFLVIVPFVSYKTFKAAIKSEVFKHLTTTRELLQYQIEDFFHERFGDVDVLARNPIIGQSFAQLSTSVRTTGQDSTQYSTIVKLYQPLLEHYVVDYGYANIFFVEKDGDVIYTVLESEYKGNNVITGEYKGYSISQVVERGLDEVTFEDFTWNDEREEFSSYFAAPVLYEDELLGVIVIEISFSHMDTMLTHRAGLGKSGEMYLVGDDGYMRSNSRFSEEPTILAKEVDTEATRQAFDGQIGVKVVKDYRDIWVLSAYTPLNLKKYVDWVLVVEIDEKEAFFSIRFVELWLIVIASIIGSIAVAYIYLTNRIEKEHANQLHARHTSHAKRSARKHPSHTAHSSHAKHPKTVKVVKDEKAVNDDQEEKSINVDQDEKTVHVDQNEEVVTDDQDKKVANDDQDEKDKPT